MSFFAATALVGCGASAPPPTSASPNPSTEANGVAATSQAESAPPADARGPSTASASPAPASRGERDGDKESRDDLGKKAEEKSAAHADAKGKDTGDDLEHAQSRFNDARKLIFSDKIGAGQCEQMCKALDSMRRATGRICELVGASSDAYKCTEAKAKLVEAESKVKTSCGACASSP